ncbi:MFS general substrate transporter [Saccharata proteae CBS 121410]|uniref:MFS general substrate transporter n=1 Tax=Saccharata proteae CBS 121410 TaxID=1314787 RepID=A0A9P4M0T7_9PEZI|nr:MFS general substrate transporter [Saccharata proteae CBS 121410]
MYPTIDRNTTERGIGTAPPNATTDKAAQYLSSTNTHPLLTPQTNRRLLRRIDLLILPLLLTIYALQSLDKTTLSYASVFGLIKDTKLHGDQYSWLGSVVYIAQLVMQPLVAVLLVKLPIGKFTAGMLFCWGAVLCGMAAATNFAELVATRFLLGGFESAVAPAFIAIVQMWYRRSEQTNRNAAWYAMLGIVNMFGSLLTYGLGHIHSHLHSYQIIFLFCGLLTVVFSAVVFIFMPDSPMKAKFLREEDRILAIERVRANQMGIESRKWRWDHVKEALSDVKTWLWFSMLVIISIPSGGITTFGPLIVESFGFDSFTTILFNIPFGAVQIVSTIGGAWLATYLRKKSPVLVLLCIPPIIGTVMLMLITYDTRNRAALLVGYYLVSVYPGITPLVYSWSAMNTAGDTKRKVTTGFLFVGASTGNIIGPHLFTPAEAPHYTRGLESVLALFIVMAVFVLGSAAWIKLLNRRHEKMRVTKGKTAKVVDRSMEKVKEIEKEGVDENGQEVPVEEDKGLSDETDLRNEDFIYLY